MATSHINITPGDGTKKLATYTASEDAVTKDISRAALNDSAGAELGTAANPLPVRGISDTIEITPTLDTSVYASGEVLFATTAIANAVRVNGGRSKLDSIVVTDEDDQGVAFDLVFFKTNVALGTFNAAPSVSDTDVRQGVGWVRIEAADYIDLTNSQMACKTNIGLTMEADSASTSLFVAAITRGTPTHTASGIRIKLTFLMD